MRALTLLALLIASSAADAEPSGRYGPSALERELGRYEKLAIAEALEREGVTIDPQPEGKRVERIRVVNLDVFSRRDGWLRGLNFFHMTTRPHVISREVLVRPGELWDQKRIDESARDLEVPEFSSLVVIIPVVAETAGMVDILVVTRDVWSLRTSSKFEVQNSTLVRLTMFPAENNFLGRRKQVAIKFDLDLASVSFGPSYIDPNIAGTRLRFSGFVQTIFGRHDKDFEGTQSDLSLAMPLYSLDRKWGASVSFGHQDFVSRTFRGTETILHPDPEREGADPAEERAPREFRLRSLRFRTEGVRSIGTAFKSRFFAGFALDVRRPALLDDFPGTPELAALFAEEVLGRSERLAGPVLRYEGFQPKYAKYKNIDSLDLVEDVRLGPEVTVELSPALELLGSEVDLFRVRGEVGITLGITDDGYVRARAGSSARFESDGVTGADAHGSFLLALPTTGKIGRILLAAEAAELIENGDDEVLVTGALTGLRGYPVGAFAGEARAALNAEFRTQPIEIGFLRLGGAAFWDMGHAADSLADLSMHHDVGIGIRALVPQDAPFVNRFDWAVPVSGESAGFPGRFSISFGQFF